MKEKYIYKTIDLYFDAQLSLAEEEELYKMLLSYKRKDPKVDEALAVMLMTRYPYMLAMMSPSAGQRRMESRLSYWQSSRLLWNIAASVVIMIAICGSALWFSSHNSTRNEIDRMIAYVGGVKVSDQSEIMKIVDDQLNDIGISSELFVKTVAEDIDDIRDAFNEEGI